MVVFPSKSALCLFAAAKLRTVFLPGLAFHFGIDPAALWVGSEGTTKEKNVGFGAALRCVALSRMTKHVDCKKRNEN